MEPTIEPWWVIGSVAVSLHLGTDIGVADVDVLLAVPDARHIRNQLRIPPVSDEPNRLFRSEEYFTWRGASYPIEFMAGFSICLADEWQKVSFRTRQAVNVVGHTLYVPDIEEMKALLESFGRPKDLDRLKLLTSSSFSV